MLLYKNNTFTFDYLLFRYTPYESSRHGIENGREVDPALLSSQTKVIYNIYIIIIIFLYYIYYKYMHLLAILEMVDFVS